MISLKILVELCLPTVSPTFSRHLSLLWVLISWLISLSSTAILADVGYSFLSSSLSVILAAVVVGITGIMVLILPAGIQIFDTLLTIFLKACSSFVHVYRGF